MASNEYKVILLGETGTGKSLFINSFANYIHFNNFKEAIDSEERVSLISSKFKVTDVNYEDYVITSSVNDGNIRTEMAESMTVKCKSYKFQLGKVSVQLIDTPGMGDTKGKERDKIHIDNILTYINNFGALHAIAIVVKNTQTRITERFSYCLKSLMTIVNKTAVDNIVFILTFANSNNFKPGPAKNVIERFIQNDLKNSFLKLDKDHMYCFDNLSYERLIATQLGIKFDQDDIDSQDLNWRRSSAEMSRLLKHVTGLSPHQYDKAAVKIGKITNTKQKLEMNNDKMKTTANNSQYRYKEYNILLLGETGTGKSLLVNAFANYFHFDSLKEAIESKERVNLISSTFKITDVNYEDHVITSGENERTEFYETFTVSCKSYKFQLGDMSVRLIDTPGMGDTNRGEADKRNVANILNYINNFEDLHAIAIVLNNAQTKLTDRFTKCLTTLLANLHKSAVNNIVFLFTFSSGNNFKPGPILNVLNLFIAKGLLNDSSFDFNRDRKYCLDNLSYEILVATHQGVQFDKDDFDSFELNWRKSSAEMTRLLRYVSGLTPHKVRDTMSLNDARQFIKSIDQFLPIVLQIIDANGRDRFDVSLKQKDIKILYLDKAITFCTSPTCREIIVINGKENYYYPKECCQGCKMTNSWRWWCKAIDIEGYCKECGCHKDFHERRFYKTEIISTNFFTPEAEKKMMFEKEVIEDAEKKFAKFLQEHALSQLPIEESKKNDLALYKVMKKFEKEIAQMKSMSIDELYQLKYTLLNLPFNGSKMKEILNADAKRLTADAMFNEIVISLRKRF